MKSVLDVYLRKKDVYRDKTCIQVPNYSILVNVVYKCDVISYTYWFYEHFYVLRQYLYGNKRKFIYCVNVKDSII